MPISTVFTALRALLGLAVFVTGLGVLRYGLRKVWSDRTEQIIAKLVRTPLRGLLTGIGATVVTQSSAAVTIMSMALVGAGVLRFPDTVGLILGTNIGSTLTVGLLALNAQRAGPWLVAMGVGAYIVSRVAAPTLGRGRARIDALAVSAVGFGTLFVGYAFIETTLRPLASSPAVMRWLTEANSHPALGVLVGTLVTAAIGSSSASTAMVLALAGSHALALDAAVAVVLGNNVGTCVTAVIASIGGSRDVQRVAATHVLLNVAGAAVFLVGLHPFVELVTWIAPTPPARVAAAHILFNVISSAVALPFAAQIARALYSLLPDRN